MGSFIEMVDQLQGVVTYAPPVEAFATGIKIGSNDQRYFSDRSSDHSHFHERSRIKKACRDVTIRQRTRTYARARTYARTRVARIVTYRGTGISEYACSFPWSQLHMYSRH